MKDFYTSWWREGWRAAWRQHRKGLPIERGKKLPLVGSPQYTDWRNGITAYRDEHGLEDED